MNSPVVIADHVRLKSAPLDGSGLALLQKTIERNRFLPVPPQEENFVGDGDYLAIGTEFLGYFIELGGLQDHERVLDIGCGIGRMAVPLTQYLDPDKGLYTGLDPAPAGIQWSAQHVGSVYPNFRFMHLDIANDLYNPNGRIQGRDLLLPFESKSFDFAIMTSVVTHLPADEIEPYFHEISRLLAPGGRLFLSAFVMESESQRGSAELAPRIRFHRTPQGPSWHADAQAPLAAVAFDDGFLDTALQETGFDIALKKLGHWRGQTGSRHYQDFFVAVKSARGQGA